jgi:hypothetical protein
VTAGAELLEVLARARRDLAERHWDDLFDDVYDLGKLLVVEPRLGAAPELTQFVEDSVPALREHHVDLMFFPGSVVRRFRGIWEDREWEQLCVARSGLQFFVDLFRSALADNLSDFDIGYVDELIRERGHEGHLADGEIPRGNPSIALVVVAPPLAA